MTDRVTSFEVFTPDVKEFGTKSRPWVQFVFTMLSRPSSFPGNILGRGLVTDEATNGTMLIDAPADHLHLLEPSKEVVKIRGGCFFSAACASAAS